MISCSATTIQGRAKGSWATHGPQFSGIELRCLILTRTFDGRFLPLYLIGLGYIVKTLEKVKYSQISLLTGVSTD